MLIYTARNVQVVVSPLQIDYLAVIGPISGWVRIACSDLMRISLIQIDY